MRRNLLIVADMLRRNLPTISLLQRLGNRMIRKGFRFGSHRDQLLFGKAIAHMDPGHPENALSQRPGLVKNDGVCFGQGVQKVGPFNQDALARCATDATEIAQGNRHHQCAGTGNHQQYQGTVNPFRKSRARDNEGREHRNQNSGANHHRRIITGKNRNEFLSRSFPFRRLFNQLQNAGNR